MKVELNRALLQVADSAIAADDVLNEDGLGRLNWRAEWVRSTAGALGLDAVFVADHPLTAELFNARGRRVATWVLR